MPARTGRGFALGTTLVPGYAESRSTSPPLATAGDARSGVPTDGSRLLLPEPIADVLRDVAGALAHGQAVTVAPQHTMLTTQQAADFLGTSRPTFVKLLEDGVLAFSQPGRHRRVRLSDVLAYRERIQRERDEVLDELAAVSRDAGLYDDEVTHTRLRR